MNARPVIKYPGAKWSIADWIISHFPETICATDQLSRRREEVLWMNFEPPERQISIMEEEEW